MAERLSKSLLHTYGIADLFFVVMINMGAYLFASFLKDYAQFSLVIVGNILGLTRLIDILCALVGGVVLQKVTLRYGGKYRSWFLIGPPLVAPLHILQMQEEISARKAGSPLPV
jgi:glycoside/pentoside/hexuronide:cation symporter, GPH family